MLSFSPQKELPLATSMLSGRLVLTQHPVALVSTEHRTTKPATHGRGLSPSGRNNISISSAFHLPPLPSTWLLSPSWLTSSVFSHQRRPVFHMTLSTAGETTANRSQARPGRRPSECSTSHYSSGWEYLSRTCSA